MANYIKQTWVDANASYPLSAARLTVIEQGIYDAHYKPTAQANMGTQVIVPSTETALGFGAILGWDTGGIWSSGQPSRFVAPIRGVYHGVANLSFVGNTGAGDKLVNIKNQANVIQASASGVQPAAISGWSANPSCVAFLNVGDYLVVYAYNGVASGNTQILGTFAMTLLTAF